MNNLLGSTAEGATRGIASAALVDICTVSHKLAGVKE
jgi:hypothetical protein